MVREIKIQNKYNNKMGVNDSLTLYYYAYMIGIKVD